MHDRSSLPSTSRTFSQTPAGRQRAPPGLSVVTSGSKEIHSAGLGDQQPYPSPPMSGSPPPSLPPASSSSGPHASSSVLGSTTAGYSTSHDGSLPVLAAPPVYAPPAARVPQYHTPATSNPRETFSQLPQEYQSQEPHPSTAQQFSQRYPHAGHSQLEGQSGGGESSFAAAQSPAVRGPRGGGGRRAKAHVRTACVNCKKAHLSCDDARPCSRCISTGKTVREAFSLLKGVTMEND
ncbi:hypothetical protein K402DRAFT_268601 [Aulographum hederae CBS 113979]|uniref:Zn(2)-C6 fungal-type domain-containing protein n=1 Tax=Aulographum hederae CBS 113979 TaxID=1176131 RepID=A0A6G1H8I3_9PEZI|nr:hypothetical protein K402DRAFT_268601 [Aulographum hederae CBS 113979]